MNTIIKMFIGGFIGIGIGVVTGYHALHSWQWWLIMVLSAALINWIFDLFTDNP